MDGYLQVYEFFVLTLKLFQEILFSHEIAEAQILGNKIELTINLKINNNHTLKYES